VIGPISSPSAYYPSSFLDYSLTGGRYLTDAPYIAVRGKPSAALAEKLEKDERARVDAQVAKLGPEGLARLQKELDDAKAQNDAPIPEEVLTDFPVPKISSISWIVVQSAKNTPGTVEVEKAHVGVLANPTELARHIKADETKLPLTVYYDHVAVSVST
jgi:Zn-dependent M16 (insulinase) family peptidase